MNRVFSREDSPDIPLRNVPNITEETEPPMLASDMFDSPLISHPSSGTRIRGSPLDQHRRFFFRILENKQAM